MDSNKDIFNFDSLRLRIRQVYGNQDDFAKDLGIGRVSLSLRLNNKADFSLREINRACELLGIKKSELAKYFFCSESSEKRIIS